MHDKIEKTHLNFGLTFFTCWTLSFLIMLIIVIEYLFKADKTLMIINGVFIAFLLGAGLIDGIYNLIKILTIKKHKYKKRGN